MLSKLQSDKMFTRFFRQLLFLCVLLLIGYVILGSLQFFTGSFLGAITLYVVFRKLVINMTEGTRKNGEPKKMKRWKASMIVVLSATVIFLEIGYLVFDVTAQQFPNIDTSNVIVWVTGLIDRINVTFGFKILSEDIVGRFANVATGFVSSILNTTYSFLVNVFLMLVILFFMLANIRAMECVVLKYQPFRGRSLEMLSYEIKNMIYSNAIGIPVIMISQGICAWLIYMVFGIEHAVFWAFLTALCGLIPMIGTALISAPIGIFMISAGDVWQGVLLILCGLFVIANIDNLVRIILLKKSANTHPLVVIFGVIMGIPMFGFWGIIFGPLLISSFLLMIKIYYHEYGLIKKDNPD